MLRYSAKAIIFNEEKVLLIKIVNETGAYFILPGGGQEPFETIHEALKRECLEETGFQVIIGELIFVRDYIARNHEFAKMTPEFHQVELMFDCKIDFSQKRQVQTITDRNQVAVEWVLIKDLKFQNIYPKILREIIEQKYDGKNLPIYLGDIN